MGETFYPPCLRLCTMAASELHISGSPFYLEPVDLFASDALGTPCCKFLLMCVCVCPNEAVIKIVTAS